MRHVEFVPDAFKEYQDWIETDRKLALRIGDLISLHYSQKANKLSYLPD